MSNIKKVDFSNFAKKAPSTGGSSTDSQFMFMAKAIIPNIPKKYMYAVSVGIYLIVFGIVLNIYLLYLFFSEYPMVGIILLLILGVFIVGFLLMTLLSFITNKFNNGK